MKKLYFILPILLLLITTSCSNKETNNQKNSAYIGQTQKSSTTMGLQEKSQIFTVVFKEKIHSSLSEFQFKVYGKRDIESNQYNAYKIEVWPNGPNKAVLQEIKFEQTETFDEKGLGFEIEDMNFDGYKDIRIQQFTPASPNTPYFYWLWDQKTSRYLPNKELEQITAPEFDFKNKVIKSYVRDGAAYHYTEVYKYINGIPTLVWEEEVSADDGKKVLKYTIRKLKGKSLKVIKKYELPFGNGHF